MKYHLDISKTSASFRRANPNLAGTGPVASESARTHTDTRTQVKNAAKPKRTGAEVAYRRHLESVQAAGGLLQFWEQIQFPLSDGGAYRVDFLLLRPDGTIAGVEIKGGHAGKHIAWSERGLEKFRRARALLKFPLICLKHKGQGWEEIQ